MRGQAGDDAGGAAAARRGRPSRPPPAELAAERAWPACRATGAARGPAIGWGILAAAVWLATWCCPACGTGGWIAYLVGAPIFLVVLFVFFENFARLLPANI